MTLAGILWFLGMGLVFVGEQIIGDGVGRWAVDGVGVALVLVSLGLRARKLGNDEPSVAQGQLLGLIMAVVATASLLPYALGTPDVTDMMGFDDAGRLRWQGVFVVLTPIVLLIGAIPMVFLDMVLSANPVILPRDAARRALNSGLTSALAICLVFPANFLANAYNVEYDTAFFRTARLGDATRSLAAGLAKPVTVSLFFPAGNDVLEEMRPFFDDLADASGGQLTVQVKDQALDIALAEELKLQDNGWVVFQEEGVEGEPIKFKMRLELDRAKRDLKRLDSLVQKNLLKATRGQRTAYMIVGHGEASHTVADNDWRKLSQLRKVLQAQSYKLEDLGIADGLADGVPDDAELLILAAPEQPLLAEEVTSITSWLDQGGELLVFVDNRSDKLEGLLGHLGLQREGGAIADPKNRYPGQSPYLIVTDRYGTHATVSTLSKANKPVVLPAPVGFVEDSAAPGKRSVLLRTFGTAFADDNANGREDEGEVAKVQNLAYAVEGGEDDSAWRAVVIGNIGFVSDNAVTNGWLTGPQLALDSMRWLAGDEDIVGETESEEDVKIDHSPEGQRWWFWATIFAVPLLVMGTGTTVVIVRRRMR